MLFLITLRRIATTGRCEHGIFKTGAGVAPDGKAAHAPIRARLVFDTNSYGTLWVSRASSRNCLASMDWTTLRNENDTQLLS